MSPSPSLPPKENALFKRILVSTVVNIQFRLEWLVNFAYYIQIKNNTIDLNFNTPVPQLRKTYFQLYHCEKVENI